MINAYKLQKKMVDKMFYYPIEPNAEKLLIKIGLAVICIFVIRKVWQI